MLDLRPTTEVPAYSVLSDQMFGVLAGRFGLTDTAEARAAFEASVIASDAIAAHAFVLDPQGIAALPRPGCQGDSRPARGILRLTPALTH